MSPPIVLGLTLCEKVIIEEETRNVTLVSGFRGLRVERFPSPPQRFSVFAVLTDGEGEAIIQLVAHRLDTFEEVHAQSATVQFADRLAEVCVHFRFKQFVFPVAGRYQFSLVTGDGGISQRELRVYT
jgi:hypothetical protein